MNGDKHLLAFALVGTLFLARPAPAADPPSDSSEAQPDTEKDTENEEDDDTADTTDYQKERLEPAGFPLIAGSSDIGFEFGAAGTLTRFANGTKPYAWNLDLLLAASIKGGDSGVKFAQQNFTAQFDAPRIWGSNVRTTPAAYYQRFVDAGYFGRGNASSADRPADVAGKREQFFQFLAREVRVRDFTRITVAKPLDIMIAPIVRYHDPDVYPGSKLAIDAAAVDRSGRPLVRGLRQIVIASLAAGIVIDSRDNEAFPRRGVYHQIGTRYEQGFPLDGDVRCGGAGAILAGYIPLGKKFVLAGRAVFDFLYGDVPIYDLYNAGPFNVWEMPGGANGIRGVPIGRYAGPIKMIGNAELRALWVKFKVFGQNMQIGNDVFFDTGRIFDDYTFTAPTDGKGVGLKFGVGGGAYLRWGEAAVFRAELAYSPDAAAVSPSLPLGFYVADGVMF